MIIAERTGKEMKGNKTGTCFEELRKTTEDDSHLKYCVVQSRRSWQTFQRGAYCLVCQTRYVSVVKSKVFKNNHTSARIYTVLPKTVHNLSKHVQTCLNLFITCLNYIYSNQVMNKRRRTSSVASRGQDEESGEQDSAPEPSRKKKKLDPVSTGSLHQGIFSLFGIKRGTFKNILQKCNWEAMLRIDVTFNNFWCSFTQSSDVILALPYLKLNINWWGNVWW